MAEKDGQNSDGENGGGTGTMVRVAPKQRTRLEPQTLPPYNVILLDDDDHGFAYVIEMLGKVCNHSTETASKLAKEVDESGRVIVLTTHKELAELKRDQILAYGPDVAIAHSKASMRAVIEAAEEG